MNTEEATDFVVKSLGRHQSLNIVIQSLCEKYGMNWNDAKKFVLQVSKEKGGEIAIKQSPIILILGIGAMLIGIYLIFLGVLPLLTSTSADILIAYRIRRIFFGGLFLLGGLRGIWSTLVNLWNS